MSASTFAGDFWWLPPGLDTAHLRIGVGHHRPLRDEEDPVPLNKWDRSLDASGNPSTDCCLYPLSFLEEWHTYWRGHNVYRTLKLFDASGQTKFLGPFIIDIDNVRREVDHWVEDLDDARKVARQTVKVLSEPTFNVPLEDMRIFFSGRKGFNIEVRPRRLEST